MIAPFRENDLVLFTGDSITDCGRQRNDMYSLGEGYVNLVAGRIGLAHPELNLRFCNTGVSGDRTCDLLARWGRDCIELRPDWVSILVGINNTWRRYDSNDPTPDDVFESEYRALLAQINNRISARIVLCSPFLVHTDDDVVRMREDLKPKIEIIKKLAVEFEAVWIDLDAAFVSAQQRHIPSYWAGDGVHPSLAGHALIAETWFNMVCR